LTLLFKAFVLPLYDYCIDIWAVQSRFELDSLQKKINRFFIAVNYPSLRRKFTNKRSSSIVANSIDVAPLLSECKLLTIAERHQWALAKNVFAFLSSPVHCLNSFYVKSNRTSSRNLPLLQLDRPKSNTLKNSVKSRATTYWNSLPKNWSIFSKSRLVSQDKFNEMMFDYLEDQRSSLWSHF